MNYSSKILIGLCLLASPLFALAGNYTSFDRSGFYIQGNVGTNYFDIDLFGKDFSALKGVGINGIVGYQINQYLGIEGGYTRYFIAPYINVFNVAGVLSLPLGTEKRFVAFAKLGPAYAFTDKHDSSGMLYGGIGASYAITPKVDVIAQIQGQTIGIVSFGLASLGIGYHF